MIYIAINVEITDSFQILDKHDNPVTGLAQGDFTIELYNPNKNDVANISAGVVVTIEELANGFYRVDFTPDTLGAWNLIITNATYIIEGVGEDYYCLESLGLKEETRLAIIRTLGLCQENYRIFNQNYDRQNNLTGALIKIYPSAIDCENDTNPIAQYEMTALFDNRNHLTGYKTKRIV